MQNSSEFLKLKLPDIKRNNRITKSMKKNNKNGLKKHNDKNMIIRNNLNIESVSYMKNLSRNNIKNEILMNENNLYKPNFKTPNTNLTINFQVKQLDNNNKILYSLDDINKLNVNQYYSFKNNYFSELNNTINNSDKKNLISNTINSSIKLFNLNILDKNRYNNREVSNIAIYKNKNYRNNSISNLKNNKRFFQNNKDSLKLNNFTQNNIKLILSGKENNKTLKKFELKSLNNLKYHCITPKIIHLSNNNNTNKYGILMSNENNKVSKNNNNNQYNFNKQPLLKELRNIENINHINNFINILKQHIIIEINFNDLLSASKKNEDYIEIIKNIINQYNIFFNLFDFITFEIDFFLNKDYTSLLQKILKLLLYYHTFIFLLLNLNDYKTFITSVKKEYFDIFQKISFCLYNIFTKYIYKELSDNKYKDLTFIKSLTNLYNNNIQYVIKQTLSNNDIYSLLYKNYNISLEAFIKSLTKEVNCMNEISIILKDILLNLNKKDLIYHIDICLNTLLYTILEKNIEKAKLNSINNNTNKNKALNIVPYLPPLNENNNYKYTIVLDIDETLGHFIYNEIKAKYFVNYGYIIKDNNKNILNFDNDDTKKIGVFLIRPYAKYFLEKLKNLFFEIVIFSAGTKEYCDKVLDILDINNNLINYRLYRTHLSLRNINNDVKDLSLLGRDLKKVIMIDNLSDNYKLQRDNGLPINSWFGDANDTSLRDLMPIMNYLVENDIDDVRNVVKKIKTQLNNLSENGFNYGKINLKY